MVQPKFPVKTIPENAITERIIKCAIEVHRQLGPGLLENVDEEALDIECNLDGLSVVRQFVVPVLYRGKTIGEYKPDMLINDLVVAELKVLNVLILYLKRRY
jgi:GxxExxY protein